MYIIIILIILIIFWSYIYYCYLNYHSFWNIQPVSRKSLFYNNKEGIIVKSKNIDVDTSLEINYKWDIITDINKFKSFLRKNYSKYELYDNNYLKWILNTPHNHITKIKNIDRNDFNISLLHFNKLIGTITGRPIILNINNNIVEGFYVDFLCI